MECIEKRVPSYLCSQVFTVLPVLLNLRQELQKEDSAKNIKNIIKLTNENLSSEKDREVFEANFDMIHDRFFRNLKKRSAQLTPHDLKLCACLRIIL